MVIVYSTFQLWILAALALILFEMCAPGLFYFFSLAIGTVFSSLVAYYGYSVSIQLYALILGSCVSLVVLKYWVKNISFDSQNESNVYALIGKHGVITKKIIKGESGNVRVLGKVWRAQHLNDVTLEVGTKVIVKNVTGIKLIVEVFKTIN